MTSQNSTVTVLRCSRLSPVSGEAHSLQNLAPAGFSVPHAGQTATARVYDETEGPISLLPALDVTESLATHDQADESLISRLIPASSISAREEPTTSRVTRVGSLSEAGADGGGRGLEGTVEPYSGARRVSP